MGGRASERGCAHFLYISQIGNVDTKAGSDIRINFTEINFYENAFGGCAIAN